MSSDMAGTSSRFWLDDDIKPQQITRTTAGRPPSGGWPAALLPLNMPSRSSADIVCENAYLKT